MTTEEIWQSLHKQIDSFIASRVSAPADRADLRQDLFLRIHKNIDQLRDEDRLSSWVFQIARNTIADFYRKQYSQPPSQSVDPQELAASDKSATEENMNAEVNRWLIGMIDKLPETYIEALKLAEFEGMKVREIAEQLNLSPTAVKSRLSRGRKQLRDKLQECCALEFDAHGNVLDATCRDGEPCEGC